MEINRELAINDVNITCNVLYKRQSDQSLSSAVKKKVFEILRVHQLFQRVHFSFVLESSLAFKAADVGRDGVSKAQTFSIGFSTRRYKMNAAA